MNDSPHRRAQVPANALATYRRLLGYIRPYRGAFLLGMLGGVMYSVAQVGMSWFANHMQEDHLPM